MNFRSVTIDQFTVELPREALFAGQISIPLREGQAIPIRVYYTKCPIPKYYLLLLDASEKPRLKQKTMCLFIIPQGQEKSYSFYQPEGQLDFAKTLGTSRVILVTLMHGFSFDSMEEIQSELTNVTKAVSPPNIAGNITFLTNGDIGDRAVIFMSPSVIIEDVKEGDFYLRQLMFLANLNLVQSELRVFVPLYSENSPAQKFGVLEADFSFLTFECQRAQLVSLTFAETTVMSQPYDVLVLGAGACILPTFLVKYFANMTVVAVDIDPSMIELSQRFFSVRETERFSIMIQDAIEFVEECKKNYDWVLLDICTGEVPAPPEQFVSIEFMKKVHSILTDTGILTINVIGSNSQLEAMARKIITVFPNLYFSKCKEDTNQTLYCLKSNEEFEGKHLERTIENMTNAKQWDPTMSLTEYASWIKKYSIPHTNILPPKRNKKKKKR